MQATCPHCAWSGEIEAFFADDDGKRLAAVVAEMPPECARAVLAYLRLFKPAKTGLRMARAVKLAGEVAALVAAGSVCKDERAGVRRPASPAMWAQGIEQMLAQRDRLTLPLDTHGYLRAVVFGIADSADAVVERQRHADAQVGKHLSMPSGKPAQQAKENPLANQITWIQQMHARDPEQYDDKWVAEEMAKAKEKYRHG